MDHEVFVQMAISPDIETKYLLYTMVMQDLNYVVEEMHVRSHNRIIIDDKAIEIARQHPDSEAYELLHYFTMKWIAITDNNEQILRYAL